MMTHEVVPAEKWLEARLELLREEKEHTRERDRLAAKRRALPWVKVDKEYVFDAPDGKLTLADLFDGRSQLIVKHYMMAPGQATPCVGCAFEADHVEGALVHLNNHDVSYAAVARAPIEEIEAFRRRMGWNFRFVSSFGGDFNYDFNVSFPPDRADGGTIYYNYQDRQIPMEDLSGRSVFHRDESGQIFHTYSSFGRGGEELLTTYMFLDLTPKGRDENGPYHSLTDWVRPHDSYGKGGRVEGNGRYHPAG
ncbi:DUF899 domain-containing protein [Pseudonocardia acaciae]|uniref:DUF899 domain-containing protein n=1 Tax=Pseudonocardia acaciae TaxID=551276 RepID=UPI00048C7A5B|nr:thioredoxin family protein [Pseudonocardia acaciae]